MKKYLAILLSVLMLMTSMPLVTAEVAGDDAPVLPDGPCFVVSQEMGKRGGTVDVTISAVNNPGIVSAKVKVGYDDTVLKLVSRTAGDFSLGGYSWGQLTKNPFVVNWCDAINPNNTAELLATLTFEVLDEAAYGPSALTIEFSCEDDVYNFNWDTVYFEPVNGEVYVLYPVTGVELDQESLNLYKGDTATLNASVLSEGKTDESVVWSVEDPSVATVDENGVVTAVGLGSTVVTATTVDGGFTASCAVDVACAHRDAVDVDAVPSTCVKPGHGAYTLCADCGVLLSGSDADLPLAEHTYSSEVTTQPTCGAEGVRTYTCTVCGDSYTEAVPATGEHTYDHDCDTTCNGCDYVREVAPHPYENEVTTQPTCGAEGVRTYTCTICGDSYTEAVPATGAHTYDFVCDAECNVCGFIREAQPHKYSHQYDPECNYCGFIRSVPPIPENVSAFVVDNAEARPGEEFTVTIRTENNVGIVSYKLKVHYDAELFELVGYEAGAFTPQTYSEIHHHPFIVNWCDAINPDNAANDTVVRLTFRVKAGVAATQSTISLSYDFEDVYNSNWDGIYFKTVDGVVTVTESMPGDVNSDQRVNNRDLGLLQQYLNEWEVTIDTDAADVYDDKRVNNRDLGLLQQYLNEWDVVLK